MENVAKQTNLHRAILHDARGNSRSFQSTTFPNETDPSTIDTKSSSYVNENPPSASTKTQGSTYKHISEGENKPSNSASIRVKPKPAEYLSKALRNTGHALGNDQLTTSDWPQSVRGRGNPRTVGRPKKPSLPVLLGEYIREVDPLLSPTSDNLTGNKLDTALNEVFREKSRDYLTSRGYDVADVTAWAWIMKSRNPHEAMVRLFLLESDNTKSAMNIPRIPTFIPLHILRQQHLDAHSFRLLLIYSLHIMSGQPLPAGFNPAKVPEDGSELPKEFHPRIDSGTCMTLVVRLIRHARRVWPQALLIIARAFARFLAASKTGETKVSILAARNQDRIKTTQFNTCLWLLSLPAKVAPYRSTPIQQQAQFELLRAMASHTPVLPVSRQGYRAVVAVQLAHKKTVEERQSAELKAPSWPPWKEEKLGIDSQRGNDGMYSRAMQVLSQMKDAGYSHRLWEDISSILAGWDTDGSPTVQTRAMMRRPRAFPDTHKYDLDHQEVWVSRIRSTRTVREAWACFLSYQDRDLPPKAAIYAAMAEKLIYRRITIQNGIDYMGHTLPGDGREVYPEPDSARDIIYVPIEPPTLDELVNQMLSHGLRPSGRFLGLLLQSASSLHSGLHYLQCSGLTKSQIFILSTIQVNSNKYSTLDTEAFQAVPDHVFASYIKFLCAYSDVVSLDINRGDILTADRFPALVATTRWTGPKTDLLSHVKNHPGHGHYSRGLWHAIQLTKLRRVPYTPAWTHILSALTRERLGDNHGPQSRSLQRVLSWHQALKTMSWMRQRDIELGEEGFRIICVAFARAIDAAIRHPGTADHSFELLDKAQPRDLNAEDEGDDHFEALLRHALHVLKDQFDHLVLPASKSSAHAERSVFAGGTSNSPLSVPSVLHTPSPATLHAFVRALGSVGDDDGLLHLLHWMVQSADQLREATEEHSNGHKMMRRTLTAIRVFLERRPQMDTRVPSDLVMQEAYDLISRTGWDWPSDAEVKHYCQPL
ncbi:hypothetical protein PENANT_c002G06099 [Penicillium antarcticum]|uniref:Uncharacterized protein n=1 Tax=Penicillium antarcticum TaxID=416450 RepID=A0A1V6QKT8_9EURO|nr:hypothetical protein PENANT_c002G06099 [Penicillium antarcticum]